MKCYEYLFLEPKKRAPIKKLITQVIAAKLDSLKYQITKIS